MTTKDFELKLQKEIDEKLNIRVNPNHDDIARVYWGDEYVGVAVPPKEIHEDVSYGYTDALGVPYKTIDTAFAMVKGKLVSLKAFLAEEQNV